MISCNRALLEAENYIRNLKKESAGKAVGIYYNLLFGNPGTWAKHLRGQLSQAALSSAEEPLAAMWDSLASVASGKRSNVYTPPTLAEAKASWKQFKETIKTGVVANEIGGVEIIDPAERHRIHYDNVWLDKYIDYTMRPLSAQMAAGKQWALERSLDKSAAAMAKNEGAKGAEFTERMAYWKAHPSDEMAARAINDAEWFTFTNDNLLTKAAQAAERATGTTGKLAGTIAAPAKRIPTNAALRAGAYSPLSFARAVNDIVKGDQRAFSESMARGTLGSAGLMALGYYLYKKGLLIPSAKEGKAGTEQRADLAAAGQQEESIKIGNRWVSLKHLPAGGVMNFTAHVVQDAEEGKTDLGHVLARAGQSTLGETFLPDIQDLIDAATGKESAGDAINRTLANKTASLVPGMIGFPSQILDPTMRDQSGGFLSQTLARTPLSRTLPPKYDSFGNPIRRSNPLLPAMATDRNDPLMSELRRLKVTVGVPEPTSTIEGTKIRMDKPLMGKFMKEYGPTLEGRLRAYLTDMTPEQEQRVLAGAKTDSERQYLASLIQQRQKDKADPSWKDADWAKEATRLRNEARADWKDDNEDRLRKEAERQRARVLASP